MRLRTGSRQWGSRRTDLIGRHEEPSLVKFEWDRDDDKHITLRGVKMLSREEMLLQLSIALEGAAGGKLMIFVPGYNADFVGAMLVVGQFVADLKFSGPVILFSWPSHATWQTRRTRNGRSKTSSVC